MRCHNLRHIDLKDVDKLGRLAFMGCSLQRVRNERLKELKHGVFMHCTTLATVRLSKVSKCSSSSFMGCESVRFLDVPLLPYQDLNLELGNIATSTSTHPTWHKKCVVG